MMVSSVQLCDTHTHAVIWPHMNSLICKHFDNLKKELNERLRTHEAFMRDCFTAGHVQNTE